MATLGMMYPARGGLVLGQMRGCYLKSGGRLYNIWHGDSVIPPLNVNAVHCVVRTFYMV